MKISYFIFQLFLGFLSFQISAQVYTIPVVVHVVWKDSSENISDQQIAAQIAVLNRDYRKLNCEIPLIEPAFRELAADIGMEFCLASLDPDGNPTTGIIRTKTLLSDIGIAIQPGSDKRRIYYTDLGGDDAWDAEQYLNIWICDMGNSGELGFGSRPGLNIPEEDGVLCDPRYFGFTTTPRHQLGRTLTHEIGHYFNLLHIWGSTSDCSDDDGISDTPLQTGPHFECAEDVGQCDEDTPPMSMNFMDYTPDECMAMFTEGQKERMLHALTESRNGLLLSQKCQPLSGTDDISYKLYPNPAGPDLFFELEHPYLQLCHWSLYDFSGRLLQDADVMSSSLELDVRILPSGIYTLYITVSNGKNIATRVLIP